MDKEFLKQFGTGILFGVVAILTFLVASRLAQPSAPCPISPTPAIIRPCDGSCRPASPSFRPFDVICPHCSTRFRVVPSLPGQVGETKDQPIGKAKRTGFNPLIRLHLSPIPWYTRRFLDPLSRRMVV